MSLYTNIDGVKKEVTGLYCNVDGDKKEIVSLWTSKEGVPVKVYDSLRQNIVCAFQFYTISNGVYTVPIHYAEVGSEQFDTMYITIPPPFDTGSNGDVYNAKNFKIFKIKNRYFLVFGRTLYYSPSSVIKDGQQFLRYETPLAPNTSYALITWDKLTNYTVLIYVVPEETNKISMSQVVIRSLSEITIHSVVDNTGADVNGSYKTTRFGYRDIICIRETSNGVFWTAHPVKSEDDKISRITRDTYKPTAPTAINGYVNNMQIYRFADYVCFLKANSKDLQGLNEVTITQYFYTTIPWSNEIKYSTYKFTSSVSDITTLYKVDSEEAQYYKGYYLRSGSTSGIQYTVDGVQLNTFVCMVNSIESGKLNLFIVKKTATSYAILKKNGSTFVTVLDITVPLNAASIVKFVQ